MVEKIYATPNATAPMRPVIFNADACNGCNLCVEICQIDVFMPNPKKGKPPIVMYPDECWYCGCCVGACPNSKKGAIKFNHPLAQRVRWKDKETGEQHFRV
jgi:NAD-dependent dihydropyrimidine dehydrogenase PreA subunit